MDDNKNICMLSKIKVTLEVVEDNDGRLSVLYDMIEKDTTMKEISLLLYNLKKLELDLLDREWDQEGYEIIDSGDNNE